MAITNQDRVGKAMDLLRQGLAPFVEREVQEKVRIGAVNMDTVRRFSEDPTLAKKPILQWDIAALLKLMVAAWRDVFGTTLGRSDLSLARNFVTGGTSGRIRSDLRAATRSARLILPRGS